MKRVTFIVSLQEQKRITVIAKTVGLCRCTFVHKAMRVSLKHQRYTRKTQHRRN